MIRKIADEVYVQDEDRPGYHAILIHECEEGEWMHRLTLRENEEGPMYWCEGCGDTIENGEAMALRLYEADY